jgi:serine/threonine protein kinase
MAIFVQPNVIYKMYIIEMTFQKCSCWTTQKSNFFLRLINIALPHLQAPLTSLSDISCAEMVHCILYIYIKFVQPLWSFYQDLVQKMLHVDPGSRLSATQVLNHPWVAQREALPQFRLTLQDAQLVKVLINMDL